MKIGIFFGGQSREREISFAGGRTVYDNLNKSLFEPVPIFVDSIGNFILLDWQYIYKGTIRDFYPPVNHLPYSSNNFQVYIESLTNLSEEKLKDLIFQVGRKISPDKFFEYFDFAFLALHGPYGEDGNIQGLLEWYNIPYSGSGIFPSAVGISKSVQKKLLEKFEFPIPPFVEITLQQWQNTIDKKALLKNLEEKLGLPLVIKSPNQGSSIGVSILKEADVQKFEKLINNSFFIQSISFDFWGKLSFNEKLNFLVNLTDIRQGIGMPVLAEGKIFCHPEELLSFLEGTLTENNKEIVLQAVNTEDSILIESFIDGKEFSCIVIQDENGNPIALPPTEIIKGQDVFDYRSKYLPGMARKLTPIAIEAELIEQIRSASSKLFKDLNFNVYARLDGFITAKNEIFLNDPNTTSGMLPSSFFFHQAAEIGLNPSQFLTYIIRTSLQERIKSGKNNYNIKKMLARLDTALIKMHQAEDKRKRVAVIMGGFSSERHISVESGRNIYEKLSSSTKYRPIPVFLTGNQDEHELYIIPVNIMLKDNADDIKEKINYGGKKHPIIELIIKEAKAITEKYTDSGISSIRKINYEELCKEADLVFIALHGRPGEDGAVQAHLEKYNMPYNGSGVSSSQISINKYETNRILRENGISVANHMLVNKDNWFLSVDKVVFEIEKTFAYPFIAKPSDDGCSSAVKKIKNQQELIAFASLIFRKEEALLKTESEILNLKRNEEFPCKDFFLIEDLITKQNAKHFLEITGGLLTSKANDGSIIYEIFEPSETLATGEVLSLEEKFLAGEGQNITPARFATTKEGYDKISAQVKATLKKTAEILNIEGYARIDAFVRIFDNFEAETIIIELNSLPGMTPATCIFHQSAINGYKPYDFIDAILDYGIKKNEKRVISY